jgi:hypothetical protein
VVQDDALDEHPEEHGRLAVLDQRVERLAQERLRTTTGVNAKTFSTKNREKYVLST